MTRRRLASHGADDGAILILAMVFIFTIAVIVSASLSFASTAVHGYSTTHASRLARYASEGAVESLIVQEQGNPTNTGCSGSPIAVSNATATAYATCALLSTGPLPLQRDVIFCAFATSPTPGSCSGAHVLLRAEVFFQDALGSSGTPIYAGEQVRSWAYGQN
jgi:hypothetical protein